MRRRRRLLVIAVVLVVAALVTTSLRTLSSHLYGPRQPVEDLIEAIETKQSGRVAEMTGEADSPLLHPEVALRGYAPPDSFEIVDVQRSGLDEAVDDSGEAFRPDRDSATVTVEVVMGGEKARPQLVDVEVQREKAGWLRGWEIRHAGGMLGRLSLDSRYLETVEVAGIPLGTSSTRGFVAAEVVALPGHYNVSVPEDDTEVDELFDFSEDITATVPPGESVEINVDEVSIRDDLHDQVADQIETHLDDCAQSNSIRPHHCVLGVESDDRSYRTIDSDSVEWTVLEQPEIDLQLAEGAAAGTAPITVETTAPGKAEVTYSYEYSDDGLQEETVDIEVAGTVDVDEGEVIWTFG